MPSFPIQRRLFITALGASVLAACSGHGRSLLPGKPANVPDAPGGVDPGSFAVPPMVRTTIQPASAMTGRRPQIPTNIPLAWQTIPGAASRVAASPDGSLWVLSDQPAGRDKQIWHYSGGAWTNISGLASDLAVDGAGVLYVINAAGSVYRYNAASQAWTAFGGGARAIAVSQDTKNNPVYVLSNSGPGPDYAMYRYLPPNGWMLFKGSGTTLAGSVDPNGTYEGGDVNPLGIYVTNAAGAIYYMQNDNVFHLQTGSSIGIAPAIAGYFALAYPTAPNNDNAIYYYDYAQAQYTPQQGSAASISFSQTALYVVSYTGAIYTSPVVIPVPLTIDATQANLPPGTPVYAYVVGGVSTDGGKTLAAAYHLDAAGMPIKMAAGDASIPVGTFPNSGPPLSSSDATALKATYPNKWANYAIPLSLSSPTVIDLSKLNPTTVPGLGTGTAAFSGRIYISVGIPILPFTPDSSSSYTQPGYLSTNAGAMLLWDDLEFSYDSTGSFNCNPTQVNGIGLVLTVDGLPNGSLMGKYTAPRDQLLTTLASADASYGSLLTPNTTPSAFPPVANLRIQSPGQAVAEPKYSGGLLSTFDAQLASWYATWTNTAVTVTDVNTGTWIGKVSPGGILFNYVAGSATGTQVPNPPSSTSFTYSGSGTNGALTSKDIWLCGATGDVYESNVQKIMLAAFQRGVVSNTMGDSASACAAYPPFYPSGTGAQPSNQFSNNVHRLSANNKAYGFAFDDVCGANPSITLSPASSITITLRPLGGST